ncbi:hypothetical protein [Paraburkholderia tropica]|nr:hypothetical protein [Paraburkholderia tropica]
MKSIESGETLATHILQNAVPAIAERGRECCINTFERPAIVAHHFRLPQ